MRDISNHLVLVSRQKVTAAVQPACSIFDVYRPRLDWFAGDATGVHGFGHAARVLFWADIIGQLMIESGVTLDLDAVRWAAVLHDAQRINDHVDPDHGQRAAKWLLAQDISYGPSLAGQHRELAAYCCEWHVPHDRAAPSLTPELTCLKDADALDRVRFGTLRLGCLRTKYAHMLVTPAQMLFDCTGHSPPKAELQWLAVQAAAQTLQLAYQVRVSTDVVNGSPRAFCYSC